MSARRLPTPWWVNVRVYTERTKPKTPPGGAVVTRSKAWSQRGERFRFDFLARERAEALASLSLPLLYDYVTRGGRTRPYPENRFVWAEVTWGARYARETLLVEPGENETPENVEKVEALERYRETFGARRAS